MTEQNNAKPIICPACGKTSLYEIKSHQPSDYNGVDGNHYTPAAWDRFTKRNYSRIKEYRCARIGKCGYESMGNPFLGAHGLEIGKGDGRRRDAV